MKLTKTKTFPYWKYIIVCLLFLVMLPLNAAGIVSGSTLLILGTVIFYAVVGVGMNILLGYSGLITLGGAGFMGLAAYLSGFCSTRLGLPFILCLVISIAVPTVIGLGIGVVSLRLEGFYLAIATLGIGEILRQVFVEFEPFTNGFSGMRAAYPKLFGIVLTREVTYAFYAIILLIVMILVHNIVNSATGRALLAMKGSESAAQAMGISLLKYKLIAFAISTVLTALGGVMYMHLIKYSYPTVWGLGMSLNFLSISVIGGMQTVLGAVLGALFVIAVPELVIKQLPVIGTLTGVAYVFNGLFIVLVLLFYSDGLIRIGSDVKKLVGKIRGKKNDIDQRSGT
ncbi:branched-chain amino acid ABC transporter permease [Papillibacter cinnamivorans]|uniref:Branched-chain amino acid transport system permease protein n=1 Tax=Papillibacter cinnamivorans DSM 12816 TaxID=1122930 RepID=A0A1W2C3P2_9FIRM|nr:branched-chain amino acid ABC transporter permease [Papillibacter cinnamivorans]SMC79522.1 branched-chain amino acid transport system permease protein [Papillibacter cinnamivorans DSM 12816]